MVMKIVINLLFSKSRKHWFEFRLNIVATKLRRNQQVRAGNFTNTTGVVVRE